MSKECCGPDTGATTDAPTQATPLPGWWTDRGLALPVLSGLLLASGYVVTWTIGTDSFSTSLHAAALMAGALTFVPDALRYLTRGHLGVGLLMTIAATGAVVLGHVAEAAALAFLFSIAEAMEDRAMDRAKHGLSALLSLVPETTRVLRDGQVRDLAVAEVHVGDILVLGAGDRLATDGLVESGHSSLDTSAITGESIPVDRGPGDDVLAGSVVGSGSLRVRATAAGTDNSLTTIVRLVHEAHLRKGRRARLADTIARPLVPTVLVVSVAIAIIGSLVGDPDVWIERALIVLVAASPCALAIAVPVTVISAIGSASRLGVIIKSGEAFERFGTIRQVALDKTGTLTANEPRVSGVETANGFSRDQVLAWAASLEQSSTHPLARAVVSAVDQAPTAADVQEHAGQGVSGVVERNHVRLGNTRWINPGPLAEVASAMANEGMSVVVVERDERVVGVIGVRDELRASAVPAVSDFRRDGISAVMLTGDNRATAAALARQANIDKVFAEQMPADKAAVVRRMSEQAPTAMIGDGINDAPALASATVGIAMGATGSAAAVESADIAFTGHDLRQIPAAIAHARRGRAIMTGNIVFALAIIVVLLPLALFGVLGLAGVVLVHEVAEVLVIANGARAARLRPQQTIDPGVHQASSTCANGCCQPTASDGRASLALGERRH